MKWQVFVRSGINNTSAAADNTTNQAAAGATNAIRSVLESSGLKKKGGRRKTATFRGEFSTPADIKKVCDALASALSTLAALEGSSKKARLDNLWLLINREADDSTGGDDDDTVEEDAEAPAGEPADDGPVSGK